ncbi:hypothetical protein AY601_1797 [Pedobacter cryoconitis]|uniref:Uncharacterized protein n=2 Tax=Pedobacter cryoconitis TaxID=188932 RepID=A0A127VCK4_9SPHI|nr:hypothetical protein AY601_1797 [Pedobacter cryoconitis]
MKYIILFFGLMLVSFQRVGAQNKKEKLDTVYYKLDTSNVPIQDRMFKIETDVKYKGYILQCKCYPWNTDVVFFSRRDRSGDVKNISIESFSKINTISITQLIDIVAQYGKEKIDRHKFFFIEPDGKTMKVTRAYLSEPKKPQPPIEDYIKLPPSH